MCLNDCKHSAWVTSTFAPGIALSIMEVEEFACALYVPLEFQFACWHVSFLINGHNFLRVKCKASMTIANIKVTRFSNQRGSLIVVGCIDVGRIVMPKRVLWPWRPKNTAIDSHSERGIQECRKPGQQCFKLMDTGSDWVPQVGQVIYTADGSTVSFYACRESLCRH